MTLKIVLLFTLIVIFIAWLVYCRLAKKVPIEGKIVFALLVVVYIADIVMFTFVGRNSFDERIATFFLGEGYHYILTTKWYGVGEYEAREILGNLLLFLPMGLVLPYLFGKSDTKKKYLLTFTFAFSASLMIEIAQYLTMLGTFETDDLLHNTWGALIGCGIYMVITDKELTLKRFLKYMLPAEVFAIVFIGVCAYPFYQYMMTDFKRLRGM